jgi:hypothetical protein
MAIDIVTGLFRHTQARSKTRGTPNACRGSILGTRRLIANGKTFHELLFVIVITGIVVRGWSLIVGRWSLIVRRWSLIISVYIIVVIRIVIRGGSIIVHHGSSIIVDGGIIVKRAAIIILWPVIIRRWRRRRIIIRRWRRRRIICINIIVALKVGIQRLRRIGRNTKALIMIRGSNTPNTIVNCLTSTFAVTAMKQAIQQTGTCERDCSEKEQC